MLGKPQKVTLKSFYFGRESATVQNASAKVQIRIVLTGKSRNKNFKLGLMSTSHTQPCHHLNEQRVSTI